MGYSQDFASFSALVPMRGGISIPTQVITSTRKGNHELDEIRFAEKCRVPSPFCVVSYRLETERNRGTVVTYVAKASSLAKTLIKPLTIIPTKPDLKAIHRVCTKESGGMQVPSHLSHTPHTPLQCHERCLLHLKAK